MKQDSIQAIAIVAIAAALFLFAGTGAAAEPSHAAAVLGVENSGASATSEWTMLLSGLGLVTLGLTRRRPRPAGESASDATNRVS